VILLIKHLSKPYANGKAPSEVVYEFRVIGYEPELYGSWSEWNYKTVLLTSSWHMDNLGPVDLAIAKELRRKWKIDGAVV
jgi:hypothetical protein